MAALLAHPCAFVAAQDASPGNGRPTSPRLEGKAQLQIEYPQKHSIFQRTGNTGEIIIEGVFDGTAGTDRGPIQQRLPGP